jgi:hypothetical protein
MLAWQKLKNNKNLFNIFDHRFLVKTKHLLGETSPLIAVI